MVLHGKLCGRVGRCRQYIDARREPSRRAFFAIACPQRNGFSSYNSAVIIASPPEVWLRGPLPEFPPELMPVAHSLLQVREEIDALVPQLSDDEVWARPGDAASIGFHLRHLAGSLDRLLTYARGESLTEGQRAALDGEAHPGLPTDHATMLAQSARDAIDRALDQIRATPIDTLHEPRVVGRAELPSTVIGLLFHAAEHAQRHAGQIITTAKITKTQL